MDAYAISPSFFYFNRLNFYKMKKFFVPILAISVMTLASCAETAEDATTEAAATEETATAEAPAEEATAE